MTPDRIEAKEFAEFTMKFFDHRLDAYFNARRDEHYYGVMSRLLTYFTVAMAAISLTVIFQTGALVVSIGSAQACLLMIVLTIFTMVAARNARRGKADAQMLIDEALAQSDTLTLPERLAMRPAVEKAFATPTYAWTMRGLDYIGASNAFFAIAMHMALLVIVPDFSAAITPYLLVMVAFLILCGLYTTHVGMTFTKQAVRRAENYQMKLAKKSSVH